MNAEDELVLHLMSTPVVALNPNTEVGELLRLSRSLSIHHFPLVDDAGLFGVVCTCDVAGARPEQAVWQFAHRAPVTVRPESTAREAAANMAQQNVGSVVVSDEDGVWGMLTRSDLAETVPELVRGLHCAHCSSRRHLRPGPGRTLICTSCAARTLVTGSD
ncbi:MAG TPA: CBS domain-containing protein [Polyangiaceae bacterium]|jgi:CBS domain-containing protein|nr:CBS domain-containing protein [Polyangiaceae bacterium]